MFDIKYRVLEMAELILKNKATIREVAKITGVSKSTVHKDLTERLKTIDYVIYERVRDLLAYNKNVKHIRGGASTKIKYIKDKCHNQHPWYILDLHSPLVRL